MATQDLPKNWNQALWPLQCHCGRPKRRNASFCPTCTGILPERVRWKLDTAMHSRWYMRWWRHALSVIAAAGHTLKGAGL